MVAQHLFKLSQTLPHDRTEAGFRIKASKKNFPILQGMSLYKLLLHPNGVREPHWHANADELGYCLKGQALINLYHTGDARECFLVEEGEVFLIPSGALHHIENVGNTDAEFVLTFSHEETEDFGISGTLGIFSDAVLGNTWGVKAAVFASLSRSPANIFAALRKEPPHIPEGVRYKTPYRYSLGSSQPILRNEGGSARMARQNVWPIAERQAVYLLELTGQGMREPHWHPETAELGYVAKGCGRMSILNPLGEVETYVMQEGDLYFIPPAYPHHIENLQQDPLQVLVFFNRGMPGDVGFTGSIRSYSNAVLSTVMGCDPLFFDSLEKYPSDLFIVHKLNPVDP